MRPKMQSKINRSSGPKMQPKSPQAGMRRFGARFRFGRRRQGGRQNDKRRG